jgi:tRNA dihydrouridine synthase A
MHPRGPLRALSVAPMLDHTDRHFRFIARQLSRHALLYTEMIVGQAIRHGDRQRLLGFDEAEHPVALQLGGDDPALLAECAVVAQDMGYDELNLNVGCPSDRVQSGCFGAVLMRTPERVAEIVAAMRARVALPVTVKHRIGVDGLEGYEHLLHFVDTVAAAGADRFVVHARIAVLHGLSPRQNREIPPLRYEDVFRLKADRPALRIEINGGIRTLQSARELLDKVDGVMMGPGAHGSRGAGGTRGGVRGALPGSAGVQAEVRAAPPGGAVQRGRGREGVEAHAGGAGGRGGGGAAGCRGGGRGVNRRLDGLSNVTLSVPIDGTLPRRSSSDPGGS